MNKPKVVEVEDFLSDGQRNYRVIAICNDVQWVVGIAPALWMPASVYAGYRINLVPHLHFENRQSAAEYALSLIESCGALPSPREWDRQAAYQEACEREEERLRRA